MLNRLKFVWEIVWWYTYLTAKFDEALMEVNEANGVCQNKGTLEDQEYNRVWKNTGKAKNGFKDFIGSSMMLLRTRGITLEIEGILERNNQIRRRIFVTKNFP